MYTYIYDSTLRTVYFFKNTILFNEASPVALVIKKKKNLTCQCRRQMRVQCLSQEDPLEEGMATHSSILTWRIPRTEELVVYNL